MGIVFLSQIYPIYMIISLFFRNKKHLLAGMERNCQLCYCAEFQSLAMYLDSFSFSNYQSIGKVTLPVPKIIAVLKCVAEDLPQFIIQMLYITRDQQQKDVLVLVFYVGLGLMSFLVSMFTAITAKSSSIDQTAMIDEIRDRGARLNDSASSEGDSSSSDGDSDANSKINGSSSL